MSDEAEPTWTYWCPAEGTHYLHPQELQVGIVSMDDVGIGHALMVAAVIPPTRRTNYDSGEDSWNQNEAFARVTRDALAAGPWKEPNGFEAGLWADGVRVPFPSEMPPLVTAEDDPDAS